VQFFKNNGYWTSSAGKVYHDGMDDPLSWSYPSNQTKWIGCQEGAAAVRQALTHPIHACLGEQATWWTWMGTTVA
jgi:hypothetical protein